MDEQGTSVQDAIGKSDHMSPSHIKQEETSDNPTHLANNRGAVQDTMPPFMKTPLEIRNQIYEYLLSTKYTKVDFQDEKPGYYPGRRSRARRVYHFHPAILAVNRSIYHEASQILCENLFVKLTTDASEYAINLKDHGLPVVAEYDSVVAENDSACDSAYDWASRVTYFAMELTLLLDTETPNHPHMIFMVAGDDVTNLCRVLLRSRRFCDYSCSLSIEITGVASTTASILKLLEPFRRLHSLASVRITSQIEVDYKSNLITKMLQRAPEFEAVVQEIHNAIEEGNQAASIHDFSTAISRFRRALEDNADHLPSYDANEIILKSGKFKDQTVHAACVQTLFALNTKLAITYLKLDNHSRAHEWINLALVQINLYHPQVARTPPGGALDASLYLVAAQASEGLGLIERAVEEMNEAVRHDPRDSKMSMDLVRLKKKMQSGNEDMEVLCGSWVHMSSMGEGAETRVA